MLIAMLAGTVVSISSLGCPPGSESDMVIPDLGQAVLRQVGGQPEVVGTFANGDVAVVVPASKVSVSEAPYGELYTEGMLNKVWVTVPETATLKEFAAAIGAGAQLEVFVDWDHLKDAKLTPDQKIGMPLRHVHLEHALRIVNQRLNGTSKLAARRTGDMVEISTQETFDGRERSTVAYDVRALLRADGEEVRKVKVQELTKAMTATIDPEGWAENGGDTSRQSFSEGKLFVVAPPRVQKAVAWFLGQVGGTPVAGAEALHRGEAVQVEPVKVNAVDHYERDRVTSEMRRGVAQQRRARGQPLTFEDRESLEDPDAVRTELVELRAKLESLQRDLESMRKPTWREATQGAGDYKSFK